MTATEILRKLGVSGIDRQPRRAFADRRRGDRPRDVRRRKIHRDENRGERRIVRLLARMPAPRRGELVRLFGEELRANKDALGRLVTLEAGQDPPGRPGRSAGDDRHLRFRGRLSRQLYGLTIASERPGHRMMELASARPRRDHLRLQFSRRRVGVERGARACLRRQRDLEAVGEDAAHRACHAGAVRARRATLRRCAGSSFANRARRTR